MARRADALVDQVSVATDFDNDALAGESGEICTWCIYAVEPRLRRVCGAEACLDQAPSGAELGWGN
jgi:hypothetical protein